MSACSGSQSKRDLVFHTTAEANQQLASQTSRKTALHKKGKVFCQLSPAPSSCSSAGREDRHQSRSRSGPQPCPSGCEHHPGWGPTTSLGWATLPGRSSAEGRKTARAETFYESSERAVASKGDDMPADTVFAGKPNSKQLQFTTGERESQRQAPGRRAAPTQTTTAVVQQTGREVTILLGPLGQRCVAAQKSTFCSRGLKRREDFLTLSITARGSFSKGSEGKSPKPSENTPQPVMGMQQRQHQVTLEEGMQGARSRPRSSPAMKEEPLPCWQHHAGKSHQ